MSLKTLKIKNLDIKPEKGDAFPYQTDPDLPKLHTCLIANAKRGGSKTTSIVNLMERLPYDRIFIVSPTYHSNLNLMKRLKKHSIEDVYEDPNDISCLDDIVDKINAERDLLEKYLEDIHKWKELQKFLNNQNELFSIPDELLMDFFSNGAFQKPVWKYGLENGNELKPKKPCMAILFDDCMNSGVFTKGIKKLNSMVIYMRHLGQLKDGGALGCSFIFAVQSYKSLHGGLSKTIRNQMTAMMLMKTKNEKELDEIAEEVAGEVSKETFMKVYNEAIKEKFDFLFIDLHKKDHHPSMFRRNFNEFLIIPEN